MKCRCNTPYLLGSEVHETPIPAQSTWELRSSNLTRWLSAVTKASSWPPSHTAFRRPKRLNEASLFVLGGLGA